MLSERPWKTDAIMRLFVSVLLCMFTGTYASVVIHVLQEPSEGGSAPFLALGAVAAALFVGALWLLGRSWPLERFMRNFVTVVLFIYAGFLLAWLSLRFTGDAKTVQSPTWRTAIAVVSFQGVALILVHRFVREHRIGWAEAFGFGFQWRRALLWGAMAAFIFLPVGWGLQNASGLVMNQFHIQPHEQQAVQVLRETESWANRVVLGIAAILIAPAGEELLFRGILYPAIKQAGFPRLAWWGTSVLFGAIHVNLVTFVPLTLLALLLVWLYEKSDNLLAPFCAHSLFNALNFVMFYVIEFAQRAHPQ